MSEQVLIGIDIDLHITHLGLTDDEIIYLKNTIIDIGDELESSTNITANMTSYTSHIDHSERFKNIYEKISDVLPDCQGKQVTICNLWGSHYKPGDYAIKHAHYPSEMVFIYYLDPGLEPSPLLFHNYTNRFGDNDIVHSVTPKKDMLIIFPGFLFHSVPECKTERFLIAGNAHI